MFALNSNEADAVSISIKLDDVITPKSALVYLLQGQDNDVLSKYCSPDDLVCKMLSKTLILFMYFV